ncbi:MAG: two-component system, OmpR family, alkaline phosphatase synthesis response regulator PhoP [Chloroflexota bacterium]|jgi:DNA-binding response OmpR family regulator|nr:two-component system, OmpR family, alkaline phosphatase synthesis response regulator PhoP [Chloroflexota bacterium]
MSIDSRPVWVALADGGPAVRLSESAGIPSLRTTDDAATFTSLLVTARPRIAILARPPACADDVAATLLERKRRPSMRIVVLSRPNAIDERIEALRAGVDEAVADTIDPAELAARLMILEERARGRQETVLGVTEDASIDLIAHEVRRSGRLVHLRPKEFQLLAMLAAHPGRAYTRRQLLDRVWGHDHEGDPRTVDVHVRWLRSKLEPKPDSPVHLMTVRGVGYRLDPDLR